MFWGFFLNYFLSYYNGETLQILSLKIIKFQLILYKYKNVHFLITLTNKFWGGNDTKYLSFILCK